MAKADKILADKILKEVYEELEIDDLDEEGKYSRIVDIVDELERRNKYNSFNVKTTGTISERLCELGLEASVPVLYGHLNKDWKWVGDFYLKGQPFNVIISVKSFTAKERLLASGSGNLLSPTIAFGLFNDVDEWTYNRVLSYMFRGFFSIYMPDAMLESLGQKSKDINNILGRPFLRGISTFTDDLRNAAVGKGKHTFIDPKRL